MITRAALLWHSVPCNIGAGKKLVRIGQIWLDQRLGKSKAKFGQNCDEIWAKVIIWAKLKSCIPQNIRSPTAIVALLTWITCM